MQNSQTRRPHSVSLEDRARAVITGVEDVECFSGEMAVVTTSMGAITLTGANLKVSQLDISQGRVALEGRIDTLEYGAAKKGGLLARIFR